MCLGKMRVRQMRIEEAAATLLQALQRGFCVRNVRATAISKIHDRAWHAARGERDARVRARVIENGGISSQRHSDKERRSESENRGGEKPAHSHRERKAESEGKSGLGCFTGPHSFPMTSTLPYL